MGCPGFKSSYREKGLLCIAHSPRRWCVQSVRFLECSTSIVKNMNKASYDVMASLTFIENYVSCKTNLKRSQKQNNEQEITSFLIKSFVWKNVISDWIIIKVWKNGQFKLSYILCFINQNVTPIGFFNWFEQFQFTFSFTTH